MEAGITPQSHVMACYNLIGYQGDTFDRAGNPSIFCWKSIDIYTISWYYNIRRKEVTKGEKAEEKAHKIG